MAMTRAPYSMSLCVLNGENLPSNTQATYCKLYLSESDMTSGTSQGLLAAQNLSQNLSQNLTASFGRKLFGKKAADPEPQQPADEPEDNNVLQSTRTRVETTKKRTHPVWNETLQMDVQNPTTEILSIRIKNQHRLYSPTIAACIIMLKQFKMGESSEQWVPLFKGNKSVGRLRVLILIMPTNLPKPSSGPSSSGTWPVDFDSEVERASIASMSPVRVHDSHESSPARESNADRDYNRSPVNRLSCQVPLFNHSPDTQKLSFGSGSSRPSTSSRMSMTTASPISPSNTLANQTISPFEPFIMTLTVVSGEEIATSTPGTYCKIYLSDKDMTGGSLQTSVSKNLSHKVSFSKLKDRVTSSSSSASLEEEADVQTFRTCLQTPRDRARPIWDDKMDIELLDPARKILSIRVKSHQPVYCPTVGSCAIMLKQLKLDEVMEQWVPIFKGDKSAGAIRVNILLKRMNEGTDTESTTTSSAPGSPVSNQDERATIGAAVATETTGVLAESTEEALEEASTPLACDEAPEAFEKNQQAHLATQQLESLSESYADISSEPEEEIAPAAVVANVEEAFDPTKAYGTNYF